MKLGDPLEISCQIGEVGDKSMDVHYKMTCEGRSIATAKTVLVCFDHAQKCTVSVPKAWREAFEKAER